MARIRTIKPEFWSSEQVMDCSPTVRLLFIGLWNFCDDKGRLPLKPRMIKASVFPGDDFSGADILGMIKELSRNGLVKCYVVEEQEYLTITGWHHQRIDKARPAKYPPPDDDYSTNVPSLFGDGRDQGRDQGSRKGSSARDDSTNGIDRSTDPPPDQVQKTHDAVCDLAGADPVRSPTWMQTGVTKSWLAEGIPPETIIDAVRAVMAKRSSAPQNPNYFTPAVKEAHAKAVAEAGHHESHAERERTMRRVRLRSLIDHEVWKDEWGDRPTPDEARAELESLGVAA